VFVQDEASRICSAAVDAKPDLRVLDACACPGGKTFSMALDMKNKGSVLACDLHESKLSLITKSAKNLGLDIIEVRKQNGKEYVSEMDSAFDRVLCDVPCSGLGIILKKPDIKYKSYESINNLPTVQYDILSNCARYVKVGGILVYSTCTINKKENEEVLERFLSENSGFEPCEFSFENIFSKNGAYTFLTHINQTDGFFVAKMKRVK
jgi:16S rRNA (cytosine967-C5)-methyltransferase